MEPRENRIYRSHKRLKSVLTTIFVVLLVLLVLVLMVFFYFRQYVVYSQDGVRLEVPWLDEANELAAARAAQSDTGSS